MKFSIATNDCGRNTTDFQYRECKISEISKTTHSVINYRNGKRSNSNFISSSVIVFDVDGKGEHHEASLADFMSSDFYKNNRIVIITSKSHGKVDRDCFHFYIELDSEITDINTYSNVYENIREHLSSIGLHTDGKFVSTGLVFPTVDDHECYSSDGDKMVWERYYTEEVISEKKVTQVKKSEKVTSNDKNSIGRFITPDNIDSVYKLFDSMCFTIAVLQSDKSCKYRKDVQYSQKMTRTEQIKIAGSLKSIFGEEKGFILYKKCVTTWTDANGNLDNEDDIVSVWNYAKFGSVEMFMFVYSSLIYRAKAYNWVGTINAFFDNFNYTVGYVPTINIEGKVYCKVNNNTGRLYFYNEHNERIYIKNVVDETSEVDNVNKITLGKTVRRGIVDMSEDYTEMANELAMNIVFNTIREAELIMEETGFIKSSDFKKIFKTLNVNGFVKESFKELFSQYISDSLDEKIKDGYKIYKINTAKKNAMKLEGDFK